MFLPTMLMIYDERVIVKAINTIFFFFFFFFFCDRFLMKLFSLIISIFCFNLNVLMPAAYSAMLDPQRLDHVLYLAEGYGFVRYYMLFLKI